MAGFTGLHHYLVILQQRNQIGLNVSQCDNLREAMLSALTVTVDTDHGIASDNLHLDVIKPAARGVIQLQFSIVLVEGDRALAVKTLAHIAQICIHVFHTNILFTAEDPGVAVAVGYVVSHTS